MEKFFPKGESLVHLIENVQKGCGRKIALYTPSIRKNGETVDLVMEPGYAKFLRHVLYEGGGGNHLVVHGRCHVCERLHLYLRVEYVDADMLFGDLRRFIKVTHRGSVRDFGDLEVNLDGLANHLAKNLDRVSKIYVRASEEMNWESIGRACRGKVFMLPHQLSDSEIEAIIKRRPL